MEESDNGSISGLLYGFARNGERLHGRCSESGNSHRTEISCKVHYTGTLADGTVFDTSEGRGPSQFTVGAGEMISGFDRAVLGMRVGESKTVTIPADQAYGAYREDLLADLDREQFGNTSVPEVGQEITISTPYGQTMTVPVINVTDSAVTVDVNHPLAGKDLTFAITLVEIA